MLRCECDSHLAGSCVPSLIATRHVLASIDCRMYEAFRKNQNHTDTAAHSPDSQPNECRKCHV